MLLIYSIKCAMFQKPKRTRQFASRGGVPRWGGKYSCKPSIRVDNGCHYGIIAAAGCSHASRGRVYERAPGMAPAGNNPSTIFAL